MALLAAVLFILAALQVHEYHRALDDGRVRASGRAELASEWVATVFTASELTLDVLEDLGRVRNIAAGVRRPQADQEALENLLAERVRRSVFLDAVGLFDPGGRVIVASSPDLPFGVDLGELAHFRYFIDNPMLDHWVSGLYWTPVTGAHQVMHARRFGDVPRRDQPLAATRFDPQAFHAALSQLTMRQGAALAVFDSAGRLVARRAECDRGRDCLAIGDRVDDAELAALAQGRAGPSSGRGSSPVDGVDRLFTLRQVEGRPFVVLAGESTAVLLADWWHRLWFSLGLWLLAAALGGALLRHYLKRMAAEEELRVAAKVFDGDQGMIVTNAEGRILRVNPAFSRITGYPEQEVLGENPNLLSSGQHDRAFYQTMWQEIARNGSWAGEIWNRRRDGELYPEQLTISAVQDGNGRITHYVAVLNDLTRQKAVEEEARQLAQFDPLTGLANRLRLLESLSELGQDARAANHRSLAALLVINPDHFRRVNDLLGHVRGDELLQQLGRKFRHAVGDGDLVARLSGDEFAVLLRDLGPQSYEALDAAEQAGSRLLDAACQTVTGEQGLVEIQASIGATLFSCAEADPQILLQQADIALQQAKEAGRGRIAFHDPEHQQQLRERIALESDLRRALETEELRLHYQPQVDSRGGIIGAEVLLRWEHPKRGLISPAVFIPLAETTGLIIDIDHWVLRQACRQLTEWSRDPGLTHLSLAVNISVKQFHEPDFVPRVLDLLQSTGAPPGRLKLEVTEGVFLARQELAVEKIAALKAQGIRLSLDDFGTGYSSLAYLGKLPLDQIKIDRSFVDSLPDDRPVTAIVESTISLAHKLGLEVVAEGVETDAQRTWLLAHGCRSFQGYLFSRPVPIDRLLDTIQGGGRTGAPPIRPR